MLYQMEVRASHIHWIPTGAPFRTKHPEAAATRAARAYCDTGHKYRLRDVASGRIVHTNQNPK